MHPILRKENLGRSIRSILFVVAVCMIIWFWGNHHKVDVALQFTVEVSSPFPDAMELTFYDASHAVAHELSLPLTPELGTANHRISLRPGKYTIRGIVHSNDGKKHTVEQHILVPDNDATMVIYLRDH